MTDRQTIILIDSTRRDRAINLIRNLPIDGTYEVIMQPKSEVRGLDQNGLYFKRLTEIAEQAFFNGKKFGKDVWHDYAKKEIMPDPVTLKDGRIVSKWIESPSGDPTVISTSLLHKKCFGQYITALEAFGAGLGVMFSINPNERF